METDVTIVMRWVTGHRTAQNLEERADGTKKVQNVIIVEKKAIGHQTVQSQELIHHKAKTMDNGHKCPGNDLIFKSNQALFN